MLLLRTVWQLGSPVADFIPLIAAALSVIGAAVRIVGDIWRSFARRCRRIAATAYALGRDIDASVFAELKAATPPLVSAVASCPAGDDRLREMYAYSAFFSWRLLRLYAWISAASGVVLVSAGVATMYVLAVRPPSPVSRDAVLELLCVILFGLLAVRSGSIAIVAARSASLSKWCLDRLANVPLPVGEGLAELVLTYEIERSRDPDPPTTLYLMRRVGLQEEWGDQRRGLNVMVSDDLTRPAGTASGSCGGGE
jgi:hypothetical protein